MSVISFKRPDNAAEDLTSSVRSPLPEESLTAPQPPVDAPHSPHTESVGVGILVLRLLGIAGIGVCRATWFTLRTAVRYLRFHPVHAALIVVLLSILALVAVTGSDLHKQLLLSRISDQTIDRIMAASQYTRNLSAGAANRDGSREFFRVGAPEWIQREGIRAVLFHARKAGLAIEDQAVLLATVEVESGFNPMARAPTTSACGLFQFVQKTGEIFGLSPDDCMDPWQNARAGIAHYVKNFEQRVQKQVDTLVGAERAFKTYELSYYLHHDGPLSSNPSNDVKAVVLNGTQFLFKVRQILEDEEASEVAAPSFAQKFHENLLLVLDRVTSFFGGIGTQASAPQHTALQG